MTDQEVGAPTVNVRDGTASLLKAGRGWEGDCPTIRIRIRILHLHPRSLSAWADTNGARDAWLKKAVRASLGWIFGDWQGGLAVGQLVVAAHGGDVAVVMALGSPVSGSLRLLQLV